MICVPDEYVQCGKVGDRVLEIAAKAIVDNKLLIVVNGFLYFVYKNHCDRQIQLIQVAKNVKGETQ